MLSFTVSNLIVASISLSLCVLTPSASGRLDQSSARSSTRSTDAPNARLARPLGFQKHVHSADHNTTITSVPTAAARRQSNRNRGTPFRKNATPARTSAERASARSRAATPTLRRRQNAQPTPEPTGDASASTTVYVTGPNAFALLLPGNPGEMVSDAEEDGVAFCTDGSGCGNPFPNGFITGASYSAAEDGSYVQVTGCMDASRFPFADGDDGGQFDVRFPNGAQCTFGGYGASFVELVEPSANRFCLRCCKNADDQENCNSHQDRAGCPAAVPGTYEFGQVGCS